MFISSKAAISARSLGVPDSNIMSLAAGPGRGRVAGGQLPDDLKLVVDKHVAYVQKLDTVRFFPSTGSDELWLML